MVAFPGVQPVDVVGPTEVFAEAGDRAEGAYEVEVVAVDRSPIGTRAGYAIVPGSTIAECAGSIDTLIVAGGLGVSDAERDEALIEWIGAAAARSRRVASVCSGAVLLAAAGLLDGRRATSHWMACNELARRYPDVMVDPDPIFVRDGNVWTAAGGTAGIDLALAMVEEDLGRELALAVARWLVVFLQRPGGQAQFSTLLSGQRAERRGIRDLQAWMAENLERDLRIEVLAERAAMSPRNFCRAFSRETGSTPAAYVERLRVERARQRLEQGSAPIDEVARRCGFGTPETMRRAFARRVGVPPADYRARFHRSVNETVTS